MGLFARGCVCVFGLFVLFRLCFNDFGHVGLAGWFFRTGLMFGVFVRDLWVSFSLDCTLWVLLWDSPIL